MHRDRFGLGPLNLGCRSHGSPVGLCFFNDTPSCVAPWHLPGDSHGVEYTLALEENGINFFKMPPVGLGEEEVDR